MSDIASICEELKQKYSPCDISDALLTLHVPSAGHLSDIHPIPSRVTGTTRIVAPVSTVLFVDKEHSPGESTHVSANVPQDRDLPSDRHWTDIAPPGSVVVMQANVVDPDGPTPIAGLLGDIVANRYKARGVQGAVIDGRSRDVAGCGRLCQDGKFVTFSKGLTSVGTGLSLKPWAVDIPLKIGSVIVKPGDIICADEAEQVVAVIPRDKLEKVMEILPKLKEADDGVLRDAESGVDLKTSVKEHRNHYTHFH